MSEKIMIKQPDFSSVDASNVFKLFSEKRASFMAYLRSINQPRYLHWEKVRFKDAPEGFTKAEAWYLAREIRKLTSQDTAIVAEDGEKFTWLRPESTDEMLHTVDMYAGGHFLTERARIDNTEKQRFLTRGIIEEAIASSQLEGASTTRKAAKKMIAENRKPRNESEWMILNNYQTMVQIEREYKGRELSIELLLELHEQLVQNTLEDTDTGRLRKDSDEVKVHYLNKIAHIPPKRQVLDKELPRLIAFANENNHENFIHPVIKAIFLHFWLGYLHPFVDGNGRLARSLFYWYMLKHEYWAMAYIPISMAIKRAPKQYGYSYIYSEQDNKDLTYFYDYNIRKIVNAINDFLVYVDGLEEENRLIDAQLKGQILLNERQKQLVHFLLSDPVNYTTVLSHLTLNKIARNTAKADLEILYRNGLLDTQKEGKYIRYYASEKLKRLAKKVSIGVA